MRARNREINIFNMSLLDILTGMLGAFLFLMIGLVPYYAKVLNSQLISAEEREKFDKLKDLLDKGLKGPLTPEEVEELKAEMVRLEEKNAQLQTQNDQLNSELTQTKQERDEANEEKTFWETNSGTLTVLSQWDSGDADIDVLIITPSGRIYGPKKEKVFGKDVGPDGTDSHIAGYKSFDEGIVALLQEAGDYLIFYRVPKDAPPAAYSNLRGYFVYHDMEYHGNSKGDVINKESGLIAAKASTARPGAMYAWAMLTYDPVKKTLTAKAPEGKLPPGIQPPPP